MILKLSDLQIEKKFLSDSQTFYPGTPDETTRLAVEKTMNNLIAQIVNGLKNKPEKAFVLSKFKSCLPLFDQFDSAEQDQVCNYLEEIMRIVGIDSSEKLINLWRYGLPI